MQMKGEEEVAEALLAASTALVAVAARSLASVADDVTLPQFRALVVLTEAPRAMSELATELSCSPSTATRLCDRLVRKGLVTRGPRAESRREVEVRVSAAGKRVVTDVRNRRRRELTRIVAAVPPSKRGAVISSLNAFAEAARAESAGAPPWSSGWDL